MPLSCSSSPIFVKYLFVFISLYYLLYLNFFILSVTSPFFASLFYPSFHRSLSFVSLSQASQFLSAKNFLLSFSQLEICFLSMNPSFIFLPITSFSFPQFLSKSPSFPSLPLKTFPFITLSLNILACFHLFSTRISQVPLFYLLYSIFSQPYISHSITIIFNLLNQ